MSVEVMGGGGSANLQVKYATPSAAAQNIKPDSGYDGLERVLVSGDSDLAASNIKKGVSIFNVTGTLNPAKNAAGATTTPVTVGGKVCVELVGVPSTATKIYAFRVAPMSTVSANCLQYMWFYTSSGIVIQDDSTTLSKYMCASLIGGGRGVTTEICCIRSEGKIYLYAAGESNGLYTLTFDTSAQYSFDAMYE